MTNNHRFISTFGFFLFAVAVLTISTANCTAQPPMSEDAALRNLREFTKKGELPAESVVANIESRFAGRTTGLLARLMRARIKLQNNDPFGAAELLDNDLFERQTKLGDYAMWLRGKALASAGRQDQAQKVITQFLAKYPNSLRARDARLLLAESLIATGNADQVKQALSPLNDESDGDALVLTANAFDSLGKRADSVSFLRRAYFYAPAGEAGKKAESKLTELGEDLEPRSGDEALARAEALYKASRFQEALETFGKYASLSRDSGSKLQLRIVMAAARALQPLVARQAFERIPSSAAEKPEAFHELAVLNARTRDWQSAATTVNRMRSSFPTSDWTPKTLVRLGNIAGDQKRLTDKNYYLRLALAVYPEALDVAGAQFEYAWTQHELKNYEISSRLLTEHLARYVDKDTSHRGQSGYWAARDSEKAGKVEEACALYDATVYRYGANWYGYQALQRIAALRRAGKCQAPAKFPDDSMVSRAVRNLKIVTIAPETASAKELSRAAKSEELSVVGLFDWAIEELEEAKKTAHDSPKINLALAKHYRLKGDNVAALIALKPSYPDYPQMFPEEMGREEWDIFYPLNNWDLIKYWAQKRNLDPYYVAGLIRQETIFDPNARSSANAYGLMQLLVPTARSMARKYNASDQQITASDLYYPPLNIELGTAYMRDQLTKYGSIEFMSVAYNAGPARVVSWRRSLPSEIDEFVEEIPFNETRGYVKGVIRNSLQYRRLYSPSGDFKPNVGAKPLRSQLEELTEKEFSAKFPEVSVGRNSAATE